MKFVLLIIFSLFISTIVVAESPQSRPNIAVDNSFDPGTSEYHVVKCREYELNGNYISASYSCYQATVASDWANKTAEKKSKVFYQYGRILRKTKRYKLAVKVFQESIRNEEKIKKTDSLKLGRRYAELAGTFYELKNYKKGSDSLDKVLLIGSFRFNPSEQNYIAMLCYIYSTKIQDKKKVNLYLLEIKELGFIPKQFKDYLDE